MRIIITLLCFLTSYHIIAQLSVNPRIKYHVEVDGVDWDEDAGFGDGAPEGRWRVRSKTSSYSSNSCDPDDYTGTICIKRDSYSFEDGLEEELRSSNDASYTTNVYYNVLAFEKDGDTNCTYDSNDDLKHCGRGTIVFRNHPVSAFHTYPWHNIQGKGWSDIRMRQIWSYRDGQWGQTAELKFGELESGTTYQHDNSTVRRSYSGQTFGYTSSFNVSGGTVPGIQAQDANDVVYGFSITDDQKKVTINTPSANFDHYIYLIRDNGGSSYTLMGADGGDLTPEVVADLCPGNYLIVVEGRDGLFFNSQGTFQLQVHAALPTVTAGTISHPQLFVKEGCQLIIPISNDATATASFGDVEYMWQQRPSGSSSEPWVDINGATSDSLTGIKLGDLSVDTEVRRVINVECSEAVEYSNTLTIVAVGPGVAGGNGVIQGKVTGLGGQGNIAGVFIYTTSDAHGECAGHIDSTTTNSSGEYTLDNLYYGENGNATTFKVYARFLDHEFQQPDTLDVEISGGAPRTNQDFIDITSIFIKGRLYQVDESQDTCGIADNGFFLNGTNQLPAVSDEIGNYNLVISQRASDNFYDVRPDTTNYQFSPSEQLDLFVVNDVEGIDFENTRRDTIRGAVTACGGFYFGQVNLRIEDLNGGCFTYFVETDINGQFEIIVPARAYVISVEEVTSVELPYTTGEITTYFEDVRDTVDVTKESAEISFIYRQAPTIEITGLPTNSCSEQTDTIFYQGEPVDIVFNVTEVNTGGCELDTGLLIIQDEISGLGSNIEIPISQGKAEYTIVPGEPFIFGDYKKSFTVLARDIERPDNMSQVSFRSIIVGNKPQEATFTTVSPDIPLLILRDPPGDRSYSYYSKDTTTTIATTFSKQFGGAVKAWKNVKVGSTFEAGAFGFSQKFKVEYSKENAYTIASRNSTQEESIMSFTSNTTYQTSPDDNGIGAEGDLFVGGAFNVRYALTDIINYDIATCDVSTDVDLIMGLDSLKTVYTYAAKDIEDIVIPDLEQLVETSDTDAEKRRWENQINIWHQTLARNEELKDGATPDANRPLHSWSGTPGPFEESTTATSTASTFYELNLQIDKDVARALDINIAGAGVSGGVDVNIRLGTGKSETTTSVSTTKVGYVLDDDDDSDIYETEIYNDPVYKTPVFKNASSTTSCPYTGGRKVDNPVLTVNVPIQSNVPAMGQAEYTFTVTNGTELAAGSTHSNRSYQLDIDNASNPHGAVIVVGGDGDFPLVFDNIAKGASKDRDLAITRVGAPNSSIYSYEGLKFELQPLCESVSDTIFTESTQEISAYFNSDCSGVTLADPAPGWIHNSAANNIVSVRMTDYDKASLNSITLQYSPKGLNQWEDDAALSSAQLNDNSTAGQFIDWVVPEGLEGEFEIRLRLECSNGIIYSLRSAGLIDRVAPMVFGLPSPVDDIYDPTQNDVISISHTEDIACANVSSQLLGALTDQPIPHTTTCNGNTLQVVPNSTLASSAYRVIINGVADIYQNGASEYRWVFVTEGFVYDPDCSPITVSNNNLNQDAISQSIYRSLEISSDGTVGDGSTVGYEAQESINLEAGFSVSEGGELEANIETCNKN